LKKFKLSKQAKIDLTGYAFILPNIIGVCLFTLIPMIFSLIISFTDWDYTQGIGNWNFVGIKNFIEMWQDEWFTSSLINTIVFAVGVVPVTVFLALILAVVIDKYCFAKLPIRLALFMPYISNVVAVAIVWVMMYSPWGPFTQLVKALGVENPPQWLGSTTWALPALMLMTVWSGVGYANMIYTSALQGLPGDVYEAADIDGANEITKFFKLTVPFLSPTTFFLIITTFITSFQIFAPIQIMTRGGPGTSTNVLVYYIYTSAFTFYRMGYASAMSWILFIILFGITMFQWYGQKKWVSY
jgi:multiple sugar transport system permease protein